MDKFAGISLRAVTGTCAALFSLAAPCAYGQTYPARPVRLVVPNPPGGGADLVARLVGEKLTAALGHRIVVDNRPGAGGRLGAEFVARAAPDGYTLLLGSGSTLVTAAALHRELPYDPTRDFSPVSLVATTIYLLVAHPSVPVRSVKDLIDLAKAQRGRLNYASTGTGSPAHLGGEMFQSMAGVRMIQVSYKGSAPAILSVMQGETDVMFANFLAAIPQVKSNRLRALGVTSLRRSSLVPELPTLDESGLRGFEMQQFYSIVAPAGTSKEIITRLNEEIVKRMPAADTKNRLAADGTEVLVSTPEELGKLIAVQIGRWTGIIKQAGIRPD